MSSQAKRNFHIPLPQDLYAMLRDEVRRSGEPATALARKALAEWLQQRRAQRLHDEIVAYAEAVAGTENDLDEDLESAAIDVLLDETIA